MKALRFLAYVLLALVMPCAESTLLGQQGNPPVMRSARTNNDVKLDPSLPWVSEYRQPFIYQVWWAEIANCEGLPFDAEKARKVQYFQINGPDFIPDDEPMIVYAVTYDAGQTYVAEPYIWNKWIIYHEATHLLRLWSGDPKWYDHNPRYYGRCGLQASGEPPPNDARLGDSISVGAIAIDAPRAFPHAPPTGPSAGLPEVGVLGGELMSMDAVRGKGKLIGWTPPANLPVPDVIRMGSQIEMGRVAAGRVVAPVADKHSIWDRAIGNGVGDAARHLRLATKVDPAVAAAMSSGGPLPAALGLQDLRPKTCDRITTYDSLIRSGHTPKGSAQPDAIIVLRAITLSVVDAPAILNRAYSHNYGYPHLTRKFHLLRMWAGDPKWYDHSPRFYDNHCGVPSSGVPPVSQ